MPSVFHSQKMLITLIVPFFNEESRLPRCIHSIIKQTFSDYEVILIDDCSTDRSYSLAEQLTKGNERFHLIHNEKKGLYNARNKAIAAARGEYICFLDSDDILLPEYLSGLYADSLSSDADLVVQGITHIKGSQHYNVAVLTPGSYDLVKEPQSAFSSFDVSSMGNVVGKLFRRKLIVDNKLSFSPQVYMCEDMYFVVSFLTVTHHIVLSTTTNYHYLFNGESMSAHYWDYMTERESMQELIQAWEQLLSVCCCPALLSSFSSFYGAYLHRLVFTSLTHPGSHNSRTLHLKEIEDTFLDRYCRFYCPCTMYTKSLKWSIEHHLYWVFLLLNKLAFLRYNIKNRFI